ncbi:hypothetical protein ACH4E8_04870 [Streptomyces sp. NPDC017979]|uniref:hypothetical protein n=1 Tax=Streptomyces sp. NPDC017979 TaxID=3365024 RepID=UPI0037AD816C
MAQTGHAEILERIADLKTQISGLKNPKDYVDDGEFKDRTQKILDAVEKGPKPQPKSWWEGALEAVGFKDVVPGIKEVIEGNKVAAVGIIMGGLLAGFAAIGLKLIDLKVWFNAKVEARTNQIYATDQNTGRLRRMPRTEAETLPAIQAVTPNLTPQQLDDLKRALTDIREPLAKFNLEAKEMPKAKKIKDFAKAISDPKMDPTKIEGLATAMDKLNKEMREYDASKLPKPATLTPVTTAVGNLGTATGNLRERFVELKSAALDAARAVGGAGS